ncbi:hypothetical protein RUM44_005417 [Polyplax serrata]|uniref:Peptidase S1 domain-containing protein n=1 Tax=Polyplax serrata TaxID=468196 RepID=A0ABR1ADH0_POLSC
MYDDNALIDQYDIALLKLKDPLVFTNRVKAVELANSEAREGEMAWVTGFGRQEIMRGAYVELPHLMAIQLPIIELKKCRNLLSHVADDMICAGRKTGNYDACTGDSGGPMVTKKGQVGIVAWGLGCGREGVPGVYTSVAYHKHWIAKRVQENTE